jgi:hypothetical protein
VSQVSFPAPEAEAALAGNLPILNPIDLSADNQEAAQ